MTPNPTTPAPTEEERADYLLKCNTDLNAHVRDLSEQLRKERSALAEAKACCAELETRNNQLREESVRQAEWHAELVGGMEARAESAEAQRDRVKAALEDLIKAGIEFICGCNCQTAVADDDFSDALYKARNAAALSTPPAEEKP